MRGKEVEFILVLRAVEQRVGVEKLLVVLWSPAHCSSLFIDLINLISIERYVQNDFKYEDKSQFCSPTEPGVAYYRN